MRRLLLTASVATLAASPSGAASFTVPIDNFSTPQGPVEDLVVGGGGASSGPLSFSIGGHTFARTISVELLASLPPVQAQAAATSGVFDIVNGTGEKSEVILTYVIPASIEAFRASFSGIANISLFFDLVAVDLNPVTIQAILNGNDLGPPIPAIALPGSYYFPVPLSLALDGSLKFVFNGDAGFDLTIDNLRYVIDGDRPGIPAPGTLAVFGLGLIGLGLGRRNRGR